jgi:apolipoprotein N-acyltransferase
MASISTVGVSAMINHHGEIISQLEPFRTGSLTAELPLFDLTTPARQIGLGVEYGAFALTLLAALAAIRRYWVNRR